MPPPFVNLVFLFNDFFFLRLTFDRKIEKAMLEKKSEKRVMVPEYERGL